MDTIESLAQEEHELQAQIFKLRQKSEELKLEQVEKEIAEALVLELKKEIVITVSSIQDGRLLTKSLARTDVLEVWKAAKGRRFQGYERPVFGEERKKEYPGKNVIQFEHWKEVEEKLLALPNLSIEWEKDVEEKYKWILDAPPWEIGLDKLRGSIVFEIKAGPRQTRWTTKLGSIPGASWDYDASAYTIPMSEGWRIFQVLEEIDGVVYSEAAKTMILSQVESRAKLDKIASQEDSADPRIFQLTRYVWNQRKQIHEPFHDWLLGFQRVGVEFGLESGPRFTLGDKTGLGKTGQSLAIAEIMRMEDPEIQILCEVKGSNIRNWVREINNLTGEDPVICTNLEKVRNLAYHRILTEKAPYILISHDMLATYEEETNEVTKNVTKKYPWVELFNMCPSIKLLICDEAHKIKSPDANRTKATHKLARIENVILMTATPILNRTEEWWSLLHMTDPIMFPSYQRFRNHYTWDGRTAKNVDELHEVLRPRFIQRLKKDVQKDLPPISRQTRIVELSAQAKLDYSLALKGLYDQLAMFDPRGRKKGAIGINHILAQIMRLKQICAADKVDYVADLATDLIDQNENGGKVLIFSQFKATANHIARLLGQQAICTVVRTEDSFNSMNADQRDELFEDARDNTDIRFIVTTEAAQEGHNLEFCDYVIFNDQFWTPAAHDQCEGRAYGRLSNPHTIDSFYVIADVDIEKWMQELLDAKLAIIAEAVEGVEATRDLSGSIVMELIGKMKEAMGK